MYGRTNDGWNVISAVQSGSGAYTVIQDTVLLYRNGVLLQLSSEQDSSQVHDVSASGSIIVKCRTFRPPTGFESDVPTPRNQPGYLFSNSKIYKLNGFVQAKFSGSGTIIGTTDKVVDGRLVTNQWTADISKLKIDSARKIRRIPKFKVSWVQKAP